MKKMYRVLGKRGRITIPDEIRQSTGFHYDDIVSFTQQDEDTVIIRREKICDHCRDREDDRNTEKSLLDFLNSLSEEQQRAAIVHLSANVGKENGRKGGTEEREMGKDTLLYTSSWRNAKACDETTFWIKSHNVNCDCARDIEEAIRKNFDGKHLEADGAKTVIEKHGYHRVMWVLANTLQEKSGDGRFSRENKEWAKRFPIPKDEHRNEFCVQSHPAVLDGFINQIQKEWNKLNLFDDSHCKGQKGELDYTDQVVVLSPFSLKDKYKTPDYQLFLATGGFGCSPTARGRKVFGTFLKDGESAQFQRSNFIGVIKEEFLPEWAVEKLRELSPPEEGTSEGMQMGGM